MLRTVCPPRKNKAALPQASVYCHNGVGCGGWRNRLKCRDALPSRLAILESEVARLAMFHREASHLVPQVHEASPCLRAHRGMAESPASWSPRHGDLQPRHGGRGTGFKMCVLKAKICLNQSLSLYTLRKFLNHTEIRWHRTAKGAQPTCPANRVERLSAPADMGTDCRRKRSPRPPRGARE